MTLTKTESERKRKRNPTHIITSQTFKTQTPKIKANESTNGNTDEWCDEIRMEKAPKTEKDPIYTKKKPLECDNRSQKHKSVNATGEGVHKRQYNE